MFSSLSSLVRDTWRTRIAVEILLGERVAWDFAYVTPTETYVEGRPVLNWTLQPESALTGICIRGILPLFFAVFKE